MSRLRSLGLRAAVLVPLAVFAGCSASKIDPPDDLEMPPEGTSDFVSHVPGNSSSNEAASDGGLAVGGDASGSGGTTAAPQAPSGEDGGEAERLISEADIIKLDGTKLFALSRYSGLSVIDVGDPADLELLGTHKTSAVPFEMYVEGDRAYVMYNGWGRYEITDDGNYSWQTTSRIQALDVSNPADIVLLGQHDMPGELSDSRKVGDVLYLVTYENGYCWGCEQNLNTRVTSFNIANPDAFQLIDELRLVDTSDYGGPRSISVTNERIYVSGWDWGGSEGGVIDVVDISDAAGDLVRGAAVPIAGPIQSRWQIDEFEGTLRVISQPGGWGTDIPPAVETFQVVSSSEVNKLAKLDVTLPRPNEVLQSVRFDGDRAYAITFEQTDPLFTFDLSDPETPVQVGELEIPGWVYHMEPRGDRVYALGFDNANDAGSLHVSLFDVSNLAQPTQLARVNFGGDWANFAEDQNRIHKAFNILADEGLILVPFAGWDYDETDTSCYSGDYKSGIQLIDMTEDSLTLRGMAPQVGQARRGFLVGDALMGVSDNAVQTFDISDRDAPSALGRLELARNISSIRVMGSTMLRFGSDWWTDETTLDFAKLSTVDQAEPLGDIDLSDFAIDENECTGYGYWEGQVLVQGGYAYVPRRIYNYGSEANGYTKEEKIVFYIVDLRDRENPTMAGTFEVKANATDEYLSGIVKTDSAILVGHVRGNYYFVPETGTVSEVTFTYDVISLADPAAPTVVSELKMPTNISSGGFGYNLGGCAIDVGWGWWGGYGYYGGGGQQALVSGDIVASQHQEPLTDGSGRVRYYLDQIDVSDPAKPVLLAPVNIPGGLVDFKHDSGRIVTMDYAFEQKHATSYEQCESGYLDSTTQICKIYRRVVHTLELDDDEAVLLDSALIDQGDFWANGIAVTDSRVFASAYRSTASNGGPTSKLRVLSIGNDGALDSLGEVDTSDLAWGNLVARDKRAFVSAYGQLVVVDSRDGLTVSEHEMGGYYCSALEVAGDTAYCALGYQGVQAFDLQ